MGVTGATKAMFWYSKNMRKAIPYYNLMKFLLFNGDIMIVFFRFLKICILKRSFCFHYTIVDYRVQQFPWCNEILFHKSSFYTLICAFSNSFTCELRRLDRLPRATLCLSLFSPFPLYFLSFFIYCSYSLLYSATISIPLSLSPQVPHSSYL